MSVFQTLRKTRALVLGVAAWFVLSIGLAVASPLVQPQAITVVCSASGSVVVNSVDSGSTPVGHGLECVLCLPWTAPASTDVSSARMLSATDAALPSLSDSLVAFSATAPSSARGPPAR
jgi:hypothetical protein